MKSNPSINKWLSVWCALSGVNHILLKDTTKKWENINFAVCLVLFSELRLESVLIILWRLLDTSAIMLLIKLQCLLVWWDAEYLFHSLVAWMRPLFYFSSNASDCLLVVIFWAALAKAQQLLLDQQERDYILSQVTAAKGQYKELFWFILLSNHAHSSTWNQFQKSKLCCACMNWN